MNNIEGTVVILSNTRITNIKELSEERWLTLGAFQDEKTYNQEIKKSTELLAKIHNIDAIALGLAIDEYDYDQAHL